MDCFKKCMDPCEKAVRDARVSKNDVDEEVSPHFQDPVHPLRHSTEKSRVSRSINADEAVAYGATVQAAIPSGADKSEKLRTSCSWTLIKRDTTSMITLKPSSCMIRDVLRPQAAEETRRKTPVSPWEWVYWLLEMANWRTLGGPGAWERTCAH
jgi:molecular chaperone DnaK (HSP70)